MFSPKRRLVVPAAVVLAAGLLWFVVGRDGSKPMPGDEGRQAGSAVAATEESDSGFESAAVERPGNDARLWSRSTMTIVDPRDFGATGDGVGDDSLPLEEAMEALPDEGGIVYLADGLIFRTTRVIEVPGDHVKLWSPNGQAEIYTETDGNERVQAIICRDREGCGFFGLRFRSDATRRRASLEDSQIVADGAELIEVIGVEVEGSASAALFFFGETEQAFVEGNYIHHSWSDAIHFTNGSRQAWVWDNTIFNGGDGFGDDGIACVSYENERLCGEMEWWDNTHLGTGWGRGYSVIGGEQIHIHDNFVRDTAGAGIIVASESAYSTEGSRGILISDNVVFRTSQQVPHPGILVSGETSEIADVNISGNLVVEPVSGEAVRFEGRTSDVDAVDTSTDSLELPSPLPSSDDTVHLRDTSVLKTRDVSFAPEATRPGLYRIHVRELPEGAGFEQGYEYVVSGTSAAISLWADTNSAAVVYRFGPGEQEYAIVFSAEPAVLASELLAVNFAELRAGDLDGSLSELWSALESSG